MANSKSNVPFVIHHITFDPVKLLDQNGQFHPQIRTLDAQKKARDAGLDLVCFNMPEGNELAFCKILNLNKWKYEEEKKRKKALRVHKKETKEVRFSAGIDDHDIEHKVRQVNEFLDQGDDVVLTMRVFGRDRNYMDEAGIKLNKIASMCLQHGKEVNRKREGFVIIIRMAGNGTKQ